LHDVRYFVALGFRRVGFAEKRLVVIVFRIETDEELVVVEIADGMVERR
jgi:hypothetical protein